MSKFEPFPHIIFCPECHQKRNHTEMTEDDICNHCYYREVVNRNGNMRLSEISNEDLDSLRKEEIEYSNVSR